MRIACPAACRARLVATHRAQRVGRTPRRLGAGGHRVTLRLNRAALHRLARARSSVLRVAVRIETADAVRTAILRFRVTRR